MNFVNDVIAYIRRIIKSPADDLITNNIIIDYVNRFYLNDVDARMQLFDLKTKYQFMTSPGVDQYNMPLYDIQTQPGAQQIGSFPVYQGFTGPALINGVPVSFETQRQNFFGVWSSYVQNFQVAVQGDGTAGPYTINFPILPNLPLPNPPNPPYSAILRGHVDIAGIIATGFNIDPPLGITINPLIPSTSILPAVYITSIDGTGANVVVSDSGQFLTGNVNYGLLMKPGNAPYGNTALPGVYSITSNTVNYLTGVANVTFPVAIPIGQNISASCQFFQTGLPRSILYYNNVIRRAAGHTRDSVGG